MKSIETQLAEKEEELAKLRKSAGAGALKQKLQESGLPSFAQDRLRKRFEKAGTVEGLDRAITEERDYIRQVQAQNRKRGSVEIEEADPTKASLVEGYKALGLSETEAKLAAGVETSVKTMNRAQTELYESAKAMGMSDAEAEAFSRPQQGRYPSW